VLDQVNIKYVFLVLYQRKKKLWKVKLTILAKKSPTDGLTNRVNTIEKRLVNLKTDQ
jgi:hypothetical protein